MKEKTLDDNIMEVLQTIGGIFASKGIPSIPVNSGYLETYIAPEVEKLVVRDHIIEMMDLMNLYLKKEGKPHKYAKWIKRFYELLDENTHDNKIISRKTA